MIMIDFIAMRVKVLQVFSGGSLTWSNVVYQTCWNFLYAKTELKNPEDQGGQEILKGVGSIVADGLGHQAFLFIVSDLKDEGVAEMVNEINIDDEMIFYGGRAHVDNSKLMYSSIFLIVVVGKLTIVVPDFDYVRTTEEKDGQDVKFAKKFKKQEKYIEWKESSIAAAAKEPPKKKTRKSGSF